MKLLLTSSGIKNDSIAQALSKLAGKPLHELNLLFVPSAANTEGGDKGWIIDNLLDFKRQNFKSIDILDIAAVSDENWKKRFQSVDIVCFGGGNEKYLAELFKKVGMKEFLLTLDNKIYVGISAGSMVAGKFMPNNLYSLIFPEEDFGEITEEPMGLYDFCFIPHLDSDFFTHIRKDNLESLKEKFTTAVYSTDDETAISLNSGDLEIVGRGNYWIFNR